MAVETADVHLQQSAQLLPSPHQLQRFVPREVFVSLRMRDQDLTPGVEHFPDDVGMTPLKLEAEFHQQKSPVQPNIRPASHPPSRRPIGSPDLLAEGE